MASQACSGNRVHHHDVGRKSKFFRGSKCPEWMRPIGVMRPFRVSLQLTMDKRSSLACVASPQKGCVFDVDCSEADQASHIFAFCHTNNPSFFRIKLFCFIRCIISIATRSIRASSRGRRLPSLQAGGSESFLWKPEDTSLPFERSRIRIRRIRTWRPKHLFQRRRHCWRAAAGRSHRNPKEGKYEHHPIGHSRNQSLRIRTTTP